MFEYISDNLATILITLVLLIVVTLIIRRLVKEKRAGRTVCGCSASGVCEHCAHGGTDGCSSCCAFPEDIKIEKQ